jgi:hypothetical protein
MVTISASSLGLEDKRILRVPVASGSKLNDWFISYFGFKKGFPLRMRVWDAKANDFVTISSIDQIPEGGHGCVGCGAAEIELTYDKDELATKKAKRVESEWKEEEAWHDVTGPPDEPPPAKTAAAEDKSKKPAREGPECIHRWGKEADAADKCIHCQVLERVLFLGSTFVFPLAVSISRRRSCKRELELRKSLC